MVIYELIVLVTCFDRIVGRSELFVTPLDALKYLLDVFERAVDSFRNYTDGGLCSSFPAYMKQRRQVEDKYSPDASTDIEERDIGVLDANNMVSLM